MSKSAEPYAQYKENYPILQVQPVASAAPGHQAMEQALNQAEQALTGKFEQLSQENSAIQYLQTKGMMAQIANEAHINILKNPGQANKIAQQAENLLKSVVSSAPVNRKNRAELEYTSDRLVDQAKLEAVRNDIQINRMVGRMNVLESIQPAMQSYKQALIQGDQKAAQSISKNLVNGLNGARMNRYIAPSEQIKIMKSLSGLQNRIFDIHKTFGK